jgi:hypothetical protein
MTGELKKNEIFLIIWETSFDDRRNLTSILCYTETWQKTKIFTACVMLVGIVPCNISWCFSCCVVRRLIGMNDVARERKTQGELLRARTRRWEAERFSSDFITFSICKRAASRLKGNNILSEAAYAYRFRILHECKSSCISALALQKKETPIDGQKRVSCWEAHTRRRLTRYQLTLFCKTEWITTWCSAGLYKISITQRAS